MDRSWLGATPPTLEEWEEEGAAGAYAQTRKPYVQNIIWALRHWGRRASIEFFNLSVVGRLNHRRFLAWVLSEKALR